MLHLNSQQRRYGSTDIPDAQELAELARDLRVIRARQREEKNFCNANDIISDPWLDTPQHSD